MVFKKLPGLPRINIRLKFLLTLVILVTTFLALTNYIWITSVRPILFESALSAQKSQVERLGFRVRNFIDTKVRFLILLSQSATFLDQKTQLQPAELQTALLQDEDILEMAVLDRGGKEVSKVSREKVYDQAELIDRRNDPAYKFAIFGYGTEYFSPVEFENGNPVMTIAIPILPAQGQRRLENINTEVTPGETPAYITQTGIMVIKITLANGYKAIDGSKDSEQVYIVSSDGGLISTKQGVPATPVNVANSTLKPHFENTVQHVHSLENVPSLLYPNQEVYSTHVTIADLNWLVIVEEPTNIILSNVNNIATLAIAILITSIILAFIIAQVISRSLTRPIEQLTKSAEGFGQGDFTKRVLIKTGDELEKLGETFNSMAELIEKQITDLKRVDQLKNEFIALTSHNLRTPLTSIKGYVAVISEIRSLSGEDKIFIGKLSMQVGILEKLVEEVLSISSIGPGGIKLVFQPTNLGELISKTVREVELQSQAKAVTVKTSITPKLPKVPVDINRLQQALRNLLENAIKFSPEKGIVTVTAILVGEEIVVKIKDQGIGIAEAEIPTLFQMFHRATDYLTSGYKGVGLGLYFCKLVIESHKGKIWVDSKKVDGTTFFFSLPIKREVI